MPNESLIAKATIIGCTLQEDQAAVAKMWSKTFKHNSSDDAATKMSKLMLACVAVGDFKTGSALSGKKGLDNPNPVLTSIDYLSHASRIIFDYKNLSETHQQEFLAYFPKGGEQGVVARSATHAVIRKGEKITELKGFTYGLLGQIPTYLKYAYDFGVNIAMGGSGQTNYTGKKISANGYSGHMYFHHYFPDQLIMAGLEQSAPASGLFDAFSLWGHSEESPDVQTNSDQFGQGHSLTGASDTYTAAGSLYFSDPVYQAKLLAEGALTPDKYGAMQVTLTDDNWPTVKQYLADLNESLAQDRDDLVMERLLTPPSTASKQGPTIKSFIAIDFQGYLKSIGVLLQAAELNPQQIEAHVHLQTELLTRIQKLRQEGYTLTVYKEFLAIIKEICALNDTPRSYKDAVERIALLFQMQCDVDPNLEKAHTGLLVQQRCNEILDSIKELQEKARILEVYFSSEHISKENGIGEFLEYLTTQLKQLEKIKATITQGVVFEEADSLEKSVILQDTLDKSWAKVNSLDLMTLSGYQEVLQLFAQSLSQTPRLVSESLYLKLKSEEAKKTQLLEKLASELLQSETQAKELQSKLSTLSNETAFEVETLQRSLSQATTEIRSLTEQLQLAQKDRDAIADQKELHQRLTILTAERDQLLQTKIELDQKTREHALLLQQFEKLMERNASLSRQLEDKGVALSKSTDELQALLEGQFRQNELNRTTIVGLKKDLKQARQQNSELRLNVQLCEERMQELTTQARQLSETLKMQTQKLEQQTEEFAAVQGDLLVKQRELQSSYSSALLDLKRSAKRIEQLEERIQRAEEADPEELTALRDELQQEQIRHGQLEKAQQETILRLESQKLELEDTISSKDRELSLERSQTETLRKQYSQLEEAQTKLKDMIQSLGEKHRIEQQNLLAQIEAEVAEREAQQSQVQRLSTRLEKTTWENEGLKRQVAQLTLEKHANLQKIQTLEQRVLELTTQPNTVSLDDKNKRQQLKKLLISLAPIFTHLKEIERQADDLSAREFAGAASTARKLVSNINKEVDTYLEVFATNPKALSNFKTKCNQHIKNAASVLEQHRGWKWILGNLSTFILSLGVGYVIAGAINMYFNNEFSFFNQTTSMQKVCGLQDSINKVKVDETHPPVMVEV